MFNFGRKAVAVVAFSLIAVIPAFCAGASDAVADFSSTNPSGNWTYGWTTPSGPGTFEAFDVFQTGALATGVDDWTTSGNSPFIAKNNGPDDASFNGVVQPENLLLLQAGGNGNWADLRWTAPAESGYNFDGYIQNLLFTNESGAPVVIDVALNGVLQGPFTLADYGDTFFASFPTHLGAGDTVDYIVEAGGAGVAANIDTAPEPATLVLLGLGLLGMGFLKRR